MVTPVTRDINGSFEGPRGEGEWSRRTHTGVEYGNMFVPVGGADSLTPWTAFWKEAGLVPWDAENQVGFRRPEVHVIPFSPPYVNPPRVAAGQWAVKLFTFYAIHDAGLYCQIATRPGDAVRFSAQAHAWTTGNDDPFHSWPTPDTNQASLWVGIDPTGATDPWANTVIWSETRFLYDTFGTLTVQALAAAQATTLYLRSLIRYPFKHNDVYWDDARVQVEPVLSAGPRPEWTVKRGLVLPTRVGGQIISKEVWMRAAAWAYEHDLMDWGQSLDSFAYAPGVGDVGVVLGYPAPGAWDRTAVEDFLKTWYPEAHVVGEVKLYDSSSEPEPEPPPPAVPEPSPNLTGGLHFMTRPTEAVLAAYLACPAPPAILKGLSAGEVVRAALRIPPAQRQRVLTVFRKHEPGGTETGWVLRADKRRSAQEFLDIYTRDLEAAAAGLREQGLGIQTLADVLAYVDVIEGPNEVIGTHDNDTPHCVEWTCHYMELVDARFQGALKVGAFTIPIGNPDLDEFALLTPAVEYMVAHGHYWGHHQCYWGTLPPGAPLLHQVVPGAQRVINIGGWSWVLERSGGYYTWSHREGYVDPGSLEELEVVDSGLVRYFPWLPGRWMLYDDYFRDRGLRPLYYGGEGGLIVTPDPGPTGLGKGSGWRGGGSWGWALSQLQWVNDRYRAWNAQFGNRFRGMAYFTCPISGWDSFFIRDYEINALRAWAERGLTTA